SILLRLADAGGRGPGQGRSPPVPALAGRANQDATLARGAGKERVRARRTRRPRTPRSKMPAGQGRHATPATLGQKSHGREERIGKFSPIIVEGGKRVSRLRRLSMFKKILIANRGEIACRIIKSARKLAIKTVAVYSEADRDGLHVEMADEAIGIGPPPAAQSYLLIDKIIEACRTTGAQAVHPGYGFLSERPAFPIALQKARILFIGPNSRRL